MLDRLISDLQPETLPLPLASSNAYVKIPNVSAVFWYSVLSVPSLVPL
jgi:hypothetical protein